MIAQTLASRKNSPPLRSVFRELARREHLDFIKHCWTRSDPFIVGEHTQKICQIFDGAMARYRHGISSYYIIEVPPRHGKSDIVSRYLPPHFLGEFPNAEVLVSSYSQDSANTFGRAARSIINGKGFRTLYPEIFLDRTSHRVNAWDITHLDPEIKINGKGQFVGIGGSITGKGGDLLIIDDYIKNRKEAESEVWRNRLWDSFTNDIWSRRAPVHIVAVMASRWHVDDLIGRIRKKMVEDPDFPTFKTIHFPAEHKSYKKTFLFTERFPHKYYMDQKSVMGSYGWNSLMQGSPTLKGGNVLKTDRITYINSGPEWDEATKNCQWFRGWDLASTKKQREKDDPDYTSGFLVGIKRLNTSIAGVYIYQFFVEDVIRGQWEAPKRNRTILDTAINDGDGVQVGIEGFVGYKDAYTTLKSILKGIRRVRKMNLPGDKVTKAAPVEIAMENRNVFFMKAPWNEEVKKQLTDFPSGNHDDDADAFSVAANMGSKQRAEFSNAIY